MINGARVMDVERIAGKLTKRSRRALPLIGDDWTNEGCGETLPNLNDVYSLWWGRDYQYSLVENRLKPGTGVTGLSAQWQWRLTDIGRKVRAHLISKGKQS
jgi:hypothetical protein